jgi:transposase
VAALVDGDENAQLVQGHARIKNQYRSNLQEQLIRRIDSFILLFQSKLEKIGLQVAAHKMIGRFRSLLAHWARGIRRRLAGDRYHPEEHYMRGPGPKTRAKSAGRAGTTSP